MKKLALVRGKFLNAYEMQSFAPLVGRYDITAFGSMKPFHDALAFPVKKLPSPMDVPEFPYKMPILNRMFIDAQYLFGLEAQLKGFDIVHSAETYYYYTSQCLSAKRKGYVKKVVATVLENIPFNNEGIWGRKQLKRQAREQLDHIIALTTLTKDALVQEGANPKKISVIGHGIDTRVFKPQADHMKMLAMAKKPLRIVYTGRIEPYKGVFTILDAAEILLKDKTLFHPLEFIFVGRGSALVELQSHVRQKGLEKFVRFDSVMYNQMPQIYNNADIFTAPSISTPSWVEQYCTALLEAQSMGLPIVTTKSGGIPENVGPCGLYAKEDDPIDLAFHLRKFIESPELRVYYARNARERAIKVHDTRVIAGKLDTVYQKVLV